MDELLTGPPKPGPKLPRFRVYMMYELDDNGDVLDSEIMAEVDLTKEPDYMLRVMQSAGQFTVTAATNAPWTNALTNAYFQPSWGYSSSSSSTTSTLPTWGQAAPPSPPDLFVGAFQQTQQAAEQTKQALDEFVLEITRPSLWQRIKRWFMERV